MKFLCSCEIHDYKWNGEDREALILAVFIFESTGSHMTPKTDVVRSSRTLNASVHGKEGQ